MSNQTENYVGTYIKKVENCITIQTTLDKKYVDIFIAKDKKFNLEIGSIYECVCGIDDNKRLWLNERIKVKLYTKEQLGLQEDVSNILLPSHPESLRNFHTDKRTAIMCALDYHTGKGKGYTEDMILETTKRFFRSLNNNLNEAK